MTVRSATLDDLDMLEELWRAFEAEVPPPAHEDVDLATELAEIRAIVESGLGWVAERNGVAMGMALARRPARGSGASPTSTCAGRPPRGSGRGAARAVPHGFWSTGWTRSTSR